MYGLFVKFFDGRERTLRTNSLTLAWTWFDRYYGLPGVVRVRSEF